jgi:hypothetical protein
MGGRDEPDHDIHSQVPLGFFCERTVLPPDVFDELCANAARMSALNAFSSILSLSRISVAVPALTADLCSLFTYCCHSDQTRLSSSQR